MDDSVGNVIKEKSRRWKAQKKGEEEYLKARRYVIIVAYKATKSAKVESLLISRRMITISSKQ